MRTPARAVCLVALGLLLAGPAQAARSKARARPSRAAVTSRPRPAAAKRPRARLPIRPRRSAAALADRAVARAAELGLSGDRAIDAAVERLMDEAKALGIQVSLSVGSLGGRNRTIASRFAFNQLDAAGSVRLVTAAYALDALGPAHRFATSFALDRGGNLHVSSLDPTLDRAALTRAARGLRAGGLARIEGDVLVERGELAAPLRAALRAAGVELGGSVRIGAGPPPRGAAVRHLHRSDPLAAIVKRSVAGQRVDQEVLARAANRAQPIASPPATGAAGVARFLAARVRLRRFNREFELRDLAAGAGNTLSSDQVLAVLRYAAGHQRTAPLLDALAAGPDPRVATATARRGAAVSRAGLVRPRAGRRAPVGFAALARARSAAERPAAEAWLDALVLTLARLEPRGARARPADPASWPAVPRGKLELESTFGLPGEYVVRHRLPIGPGGRMAQVRINRRLIPVLEAALAEAAARDLVQHIRRFGGTFKLRTKRRPDGTELRPPTYSTHSYGVSFDLNPDAAGGDVHPELAAVFEKYGFVWGKYFKNNYDPMHFQFVAEY